MKIVVKLSDEALARYNNRVMQVDWQKVFFQALCNGEVGIEVEEPAVRYVINLPENTKIKEKV